MAFPRLKFTKLWTNPTDFPTIQTDENQVRADMQALHDEALSGLNKLAESLEAEGAGANIGVTMPYITGSTDKGTVQQAIDALGRSIQMGGAVPGGGAAGQVLSKASEADNDLKWQDPIPAYLSEGSILSNRTKEMLGLSSTAVADNAFSVLGKYNQHWWDRRVNLENGGYVAKTTDYVPGGTTFLSKWGKVTITASAQYEVDSNTGEITLLNPITVVSDADSGNLTEAQVNSLRGKYCKGFYCTGQSGDTDRILFLDQDAAVEWRWNSSSTECGVRVNSGLGPELVSEFASNKMIGEWDCLYSADRNAFPDSGIVSGYEYNYLGIPFNNAVTAPKIATGSYVGTGSSAYVSVGFKPKLVIIYNSKAVNADYLGCIMVPGGGFLNNGLTAAVEFTDTSFKQPSSFYTSGPTYYYTAIG